MCQVGQAVCSWLWTAASTRVASLEPRSARRHGEAPVASLCSRLPAGRARPWPGLWPEGTSQRTQAGQVCPSWPLGWPTGQGQSGPSVPPVAFEKGCASSAASLAGGVCCRGPALWATLSEPPLCCSPHCRACRTLLQMSLPVLAWGITRYRVLRERLLQRAGLGMAPPENQLPGAWLVLPTKCAQGLAQTRVAVQGWSWQECCPEPCHLHEGTAATAPALPQVPPRHGVHSLGPNTAHATSIRHPENVSGWKSLQIQCLTENDQTPSLSVLSKGNAGEGENVPHFLFQTVKPTNAVPRLASACKAAGGRRSRGLLGPVHGRL